MSSNRLIYDQCAYSKKINESVGPLEYVLNPLKYENCKKCRHEFGLVGGASVSHIKGNLVDLENDLRGATRQASLCPSNKYKPSNSNILNIKGKGCQGARNVDTDMVHLPSCQMIRYKPTPLPRKLNLDNCPSPNMNSVASCQDTQCKSNCN